MFALRRDAVRLASDYDAILTMHKISLTINFADPRLSETAFQSSLADAIERGVVFAYRIGEELYGWLWLAYMDESRVHVRQIEVVKRYWGQGVGKTIMRDAIAMAIEQGCRMMTLNVTKSNQRAVGLYSGLGFEVVEDKGARQLMRLDLASIAERDPLLLQVRSHPQA